MIKDQDTNIVYLSEWLSDKNEGYPGLFKRLTTLLNKLGIKWDVLKHTNDYWARDYMPIQVSKDDFLKFKYRPDYLYKVEGREQYITDCSDACAELGIKYRESDIIIDGGNIVWCGEYAIITDKVFEENDVPKNDEKLSAAIENALGHKVIFIPWVRHAEPHEEGKDVFGHADGFIKYCGNNKILMSNHREAHPEEADAIRQVLENHGFEVTEMLYDVPDPNTDLNWAYINFLQVGLEIIMPCFGIDEDKQAERYVTEAFPECNVHTIRMKSVAYKGGALHCLTWNIVR